MLTRLVSSQVSGSIENLVVSLSGIGTYGRSLQQNGIQVHALHLTTWFSLPRVFFGLVRLVMSTRPDVIMTWLYHADLLGLAAGKLTGTPVIWNLRCAELDKTDHPAGLILLRSLLAKLSSYAESIIANSDAGKKAHQAIGYRNTSWSVIPNGFDTDMLRPSTEHRKNIRTELGLDAETLLVGIVARVHPMKDHKNFLRAAMIVSEKYPDVHFVLVGRDANRTNKLLLKQFKGKKIPNTIHFLGEKNPVTPYLSSLDILVSSSYSEGFPNTIAEAMSCGVPCVVTNAGDSENIVGEAGMVVPVKNSDKLAAAIEKILVMDKQERVRLGSHGRDRIKQFYSIEVIAGEYKKTYEAAAR